MTCAVCHKSITNSEYRYRETAEKFINVHRACCLEDSKWTELDNQIIKAAATEKAVYSDLREIEKIRAVTMDYIAALAEELGK